MEQNSGIENSLVLQYSTSQTNEVRDDFNDVLPTGEDMNYRHRLMKTHSRIEGLNYPKTASFCRAASGFKEGDQSTSTMEITFRHSRGLVKKLKLKLK